MLTLGTAGHIDHGKTTLTRLLTGLDTDRLPEEKQRGISIDLGFAPLDLAPDLRVGLVDVPGHERFVHNMVAGVSGIHGYVLVVAADEGVMPQTREHLRILRLLGVEEGLVVLSKIDVADPEMVPLVGEELRTLIRDEGMAVPEVVGYSALRPETLAGVREHLVRLAGRLVEPGSEGLLRIPIDRAFSLKGRGTVVTGTVLSGRVEVGQEVELLPGGAASRVRSIHCFGEEATSAAAGARAALNLPDLATEQLERGMVVAARGCFVGASVLDVRVELARGLPEGLQQVRTGSRVRVHMGTAELGGRIHLLEASTLAAGERTLAQLRLDRPTVAMAGDRFLVRSLSPLLTLGGGTVLEVGAPRHKRSRTVVPRLERIEAEGLPGAVYGWLSRASELLAGPERIAEALSTPARTLRALLKDRGVVGLVRRDGASGPLWGEVRRVERAEALLLSAASAFHRSRPVEAGAPRDALAAAAGLGVPIPVVDALFRHLASQGRIRDEEGRISLPDHRVRHRADVSPRRDRIMAWIAAQDTPFQGLHNLAEAAGLAEKPALAALDSMVKAGDLVRLVGGIYAPAGTIRELTAKVMALLERRAPKAVTAQEFKAELGLTRKALIPLLEWLDESGETLRSGEGRVRRPGR